MSFAYSSPVSGDSDVEFAPKLFIDWTQMHKQIQMICWPNAQNATPPSGTPTSSPHSFSSLSPSSSISSVLILGLDGSVALRVEKQFQSNEAKSPPSTSISTSSCSPSSSISSSSSPSPSSPSSSPSPSLPDISKRFVCALSSTIWKIYSENSDEMMRSMMKISSNGNVNPNGEEDEFEVFKQNLIQKEEEEILREEGEGEGEGEGERERDSHGKGEEESEKKENAPRPFQSQTTSTSSSPSPSSVSNHSNSPSSPSPPISAAAVITSPSSSPSPAASASSTPSSSSSSSSSPSPFIPFSVSHSLVGFPSGILPSSSSSLRRLIIRLTDGTVHMSRCGRFLVAMVTDTKAPLGSSSIIFNQIVMRVKHIKKAF